MKNKNRGRHFEASSKRSVKPARLVKNIILTAVVCVLTGVLIFTLVARISGNTPALFGFSIYRVSSESMIPYLEVGDIILCQECDPLTLREGDIITYNGTSGELAGKKVTHRVVAEAYADDSGQYYLVTKGDNNPAEDTPVSVSQVIGKMIAKMGWLKLLFDFFLTPWGLLTIVALILLAFSGEIVSFVKALRGWGGDRKQEDIHTIMERVQREDAARQSEPSDAASDPPQE